MIIRAERTVTDGRVKYHRRVLRRAVLSILLLAACSEHDPVTRTIHRIAGAAEKRDAGAVVAYLASDYSGSAGTSAETEATLRRYLFGYRSIDIEIRDLETTDFGDSGRATFTAVLSGQPKKIQGLDQILPRSAAYRFEVVLVQEEGEWKITSARWSEIQRER